MNKRTVASVTDMRYLNSCGEPARSGRGARMNPLHLNFLLSAIYSMSFSVFVVVCCGCLQWLCIVDVSLWLCVYECLFVVVFVVICL